MENSTIIAIIGAGNMGASLLGGLIANHYPAANIWITDADTEKLTKLKHQFHVNTTTDNKIVIEKADVVIFAVKPQIFADVIRPIASLLQQRRPLIISVAAGIREEAIQKWIGCDIAIVRTMPNTPALIGAGATALYANGFVTQKQRDMAETILRAVSVTVWISDEKLMDTITALSGSGPAYFFLVIEALQNAAVDAGLPADIARLLTLQTAYGAARMALESEFDAAQLRQHVTSPGGTTEAALNVMENNHLRDIFQQAITAAKNRSEELAQVLDK